MPLLVGGRRRSSLCSVSFLSIFRSVSLFNIGVKEGERERERGRREKGERGREGVVNSNINSNSKEDDQDEWRMEKMVGKGRT